MAACLTKDRDQTVDYSWSQRIVRWVGLEAELLLIFLTCTKTDIVTDNLSNYFMRNWDNFSKLLDKKVFLCHAEIFKWNSFCYYTCKGCSTTKTNHIYQSVRYWNLVEQIIQPIFGNRNKVRYLPVTWQYRIWCQPQNPVRIPLAIRLRRVCVTASSGTAAPLFKATFEINSTILDDSPTRWIVFLRKLFP